MVANLTWEDIYTRGVRVKVHISKWTGRKTLNFSELGLVAKNGSDAKTLNKLFTPGVKRLVDKKKIGSFTSIESRARNALDWHSLPLPLEGYFVTDERFLSLQKQLESLKTEYYQAVDDFLKEYDSIIEDMLGEYIDYASQILYDKIEVEGMNRDEFGIYFANKIRLLYPSAYDLRKKFQFTYTVEQITAPKEIETQIKEAAAHKEEIEMKANSRDAIRKHYLEQQEELIDKFLRNAASSLRKELVDIVEHVKNVISKGERFTEASLNSMRDKINRIRGLNFIGDSTVENLMQQLDGYLDNSAEHYRNDEEALSRFSNALGEIGSNIRESGITNVDEAIANFADLGSRKMKL